MTRHRAGIILNDLVCPTYIHDTIQVLGDEDNIELILILEVASGRKPGHLPKLVKIFRQTGALGVVNSLAFALLQTIEGKLIYFSGRSVRKHFAKLKLDLGDFGSCIEVEALPSGDGSVLRYKNEDLKSLGRLNLDVIVNGNENTVYCRKISGSSRLGLISLRLGGNRRGDGMPPAFREVYERAPSTEFTIQIFSEDRDEGTVLYRGEVATKRTYTANLVHLHRESGPFLAFIVNRLLNRDTSIKSEEKRPAAGIIHKPPNVWRTAHYVLKCFMLYATLFIERKILQKDQRWGVAYSRKFWSDVALSGGKRIANPKHRFLADPFVFKKDGKHHVFVEDYDFRRGLGAISCVVVGPDDSHEIIDNILVEPFHLSFPFIFEECGEIFMLPETHQSNSIRLYRCVEFPRKWEFDTELLRGVSAADTMLIKRRGKWFMLTNMSQFASGDHLSQLHVFWSAKLRSSDWKPLSPLPIVHSSRIGRNAGLLSGKNGEWFRVRQRQAFNQYGAGFSIAKITQLDLEGYSEESIAEIEPVFFDDLKGTHHMHGVEDFTVYDFVKAERYS